MTYRRNPGQERARNELLTAGKRFCLVYGGSRCVSADTVLDGHVLTIAQLANIGRPVVVKTSWGSQWAEAPFRKGACRMLEFTVGNLVVTVTPDHRFWDGSRWVQARALSVGDKVAVRTSDQTLPPSNSECDLSGSPLDDLHCLQTRADYLGGCLCGRRQCGRQLHQLAEFYQVCRASQLGALVHTRACLPSEARGSDIHEPHQHQPGPSDTLSGHMSRLPSMTGVCCRQCLAFEFAALACEQIFGQFQPQRQDAMQCHAQSCRGISFRSDLDTDQDQCFSRGSLPYDAPFADGYSLCQINSITETAEQDYYTLHVPGCEQYFANGVLHHNSGKTFELCGTVAERALLAPGSRHLIVRQEGTSAKRAIVKGTWPAMMKLRFPGVGCEWREQYGYFTLENGSEIWAGGLNDDAALEKILGNEYATIYMNEASEVRYSAFTLLRSRLAQQVNTIKGKPLSQRFYVDLNPTTRQHWTYRLWIEGVDPESQLPQPMDQFGHVVVNPFDNAENLSQEYLNDLNNLPPRARKRFLEGAYVEDVEDALWRRNVFRRTQNVPPLRRIVVAIDPAVTLEAGSDETGIVCAGVDANGIGYVLEDDSGKYRPEDWARRALALFDQYRADRIVAEVNQGGDMVEATIRAIRPHVPFRAVRATRSKLIRAEPVAALYERGKIMHVGEFTALEDQQCSFTTGFDRKAAGYSPDRVDALVWAFTDLFPDLSASRDEHDEADDDWERAWKSRSETTGY